MDYPRVCGSLVIVPEIVKFVKVVDGGNLRMRHAGAADGFHGERQLAENYLSISSQCGNPILV
jgi:hypothetical protein